MRGVLSIPVRVAGAANDAERREIANRRAAQPQSVGFRRGRGSRGDFEEPVDARFERQTSTPG